MENIVCHLKKEDEKRKIKRYTDYLYDLLVDGEKYTEYFEKRLKHLKRIYNLKYNEK